MEKKEKKPAGYWDYEHCKEEANKYSSKSEFQKGNGTAYAVARKKRWINDWFGNKINPNNTWTKERCKEEALKYNTIKDFRANSAVAYGVACRNKWIKDYTWLKATKVSKLFWTKEKCYDLALGCKTRTELRKKSSKAYASALKNEWFDDYTWFLSEHEARSKACKGRNLIWTKEMCENEARKYSCKQEFHKGSSGAYTAALKNGWLVDYTWLETPSPYDIDTEYSIYAYEDKDNNSVYVGLSNCVRRRHRQHIVGHMEHGVRKFDSVHKYFEKVGKEIPTPIIKMDGLTKQDAQYYEDWHKKAYEESGWKVINKGKTGLNVSSIGYRKMIWTKEKCYETALKYASIRDFRENDVTAYNKANRNGWLKDYTWLSRETTIHNYYNNYERCKEEALKYNSKGKFRKGCGSAYNWALKNGWLDDYTWFIDKGEAIKDTRVLINTYEHCYQVAKSCETLKEFREKHVSCYTTSCRNGWRNDYVWLTPAKQYKWDYKHCKEEALKYRTRKAFCKENGSAYLSSRKNGWLDEFFPKAA